jgi:hypothetical protein
MWNSKQPLRHVTAAALGRDRRPVVHAVTVLWHLGVDAGQDGDSAIRAHDSLDGEVTAPFTG